ncbi:MAG: hypothetical protein ACTSPQ_15845 [Candidatus Helarchaeota archaeon]
MKEVKIVCHGQIEDLENKLTEFDVEFINKLPEKLVDDNIYIFRPPDDSKKKIPDSKIGVDIFNFIMNGGTSIFIVPPDEKNIIYFEGFKIFELFNVEPEIVSKRVLLHKTAHMVNIDMNYYKSNKKAVEKYVHFLTDFRKFDQEEILMEGEFEPVFYILHEGAGNIVFYGLPVKDFISENIDRLIKYILEDYSFYWREIDFDPNLFKMIYEKSKNKEHLLQDFIDNFLKFKHFEDIMKIEDENLQLKIINSIDENFLKRSFGKLSAPQLERQYKTIFKQMNKKKYRPFINAARKYLIKRIAIDKNIPLKVFNRLYEADILPEEASSLIVFYIEPKNERELENYLKNLSELIEWNEELNLFDDRKLKKMRSQMRNKFR